MFTKFLVPCFLLLAMLYPRMGRTTSAEVVTPHVRAELIAHAPQGITPGKTVEFGLHLSHAPGWHTYWKNPGDSGLPTTMSWILPPGFAMGAIDWPAPHRLPYGPLMNYGYDGKILLPVRLSVPPDFKGDALRVALQADWLVCKEICIPETGRFELLLAATKPLTDNATFFSVANTSKPATLEGITARGRVKKGVLIVEVSGLPQTMVQQQLLLFPEVGGVVEHAAAVQTDWKGDHVMLRVALSPQRSSSPATIRSVLSTADSKVAITLTIPIAGGWQDKFAAAVVARPQGTLTELHENLAPDSLPYLTVIFLAFLGGSVLNMMPCVFPILSIKIFSLAQHTDSRTRQVAGGLAYTVGVVASFVALAGLLLFLRNSGEQLGWGFQLQSPVFVASLAVLFTVFGLNLAGMFEFSTVLPSSVSTFRARHPLIDDA